MKNLAFLFLFITLFVACNSNSNSFSEEKLPVTPKQWLSQIKNEEAKKRTTDVLEKIYISTAYSVLEKDSLSEIQVKFANCELYDSTKDIRMFKGWKAETYRDISEGRSRNVYELLSFYEKDTAVFKAALNVILDTSFLYIGSERYPHLEYGTRSNDVTVVSKVNSSKELIEKEKEILELIDSSRENDNKYKVASQKLFQLLKDPLSYDYDFPEINKKIRFLSSNDKRLRIFYFPKYKLTFYEGGDDADVYIQYQKSGNSELIVDKIECREVNEHNYCNPMFPKQVFQVEKNRNPVFIILHEYNGSMGGERYTILQAIEIKEGKAIPCKDCIEGEELKVYHRYNRTGSFPVFNVEKQQLSLISHPFVHTNLNLTVIRRYVLQWNGQQFVSIPLKLYCEE